MPEYNFVASDRGGKKISGQMNANNEGELRMALHERGLRPVQIFKDGEQETFFQALKKKLNIHDRVPVFALTNYFKQIRAMLAGGLNIIQATDLCSEQQTNEILKKIRVRKHLWETLAGYPNTFDRSIIVMIQMGETNNDLENMLGRVIKFLDCRSKAKTFMRWLTLTPLFLLALAIGNIIGIAFFLRHRSSTFFDVTQWLLENWYFLILAVVILSLMVWQYLRTKEGRAVFQKTILRTPGLGDIYRKSGVAQFTRTLSTLLVSGVPMLEALDITKSEADLFMFEVAIRGMRKQIEVGQNFASSMLSQEIFPKMLVQICAAGESQERLDTLLEKAADFYEDEVNTLTQRISKIVLPLLYLGAAGLTLFIVISILLSIAGGT